MSFKKEKISKTREFDDLLGVIAQQEKQIASLDQEAATAIQSLQEKKKKLDKGISSIEQQRQEDVESCQADIALALSEGKGIIQAKIERIQAELDKRGIGGLEIDYRHLSVELNQDTLQTAIREASSSKARSIREYSVGFINELIQYQEQDPISLHFLRIGSSNIDFSIGSSQDNHLVCGICLDWNNDTLDESIAEYFAAEYFADEVIIKHFQEKDRKKGESGETELTKQVESLSMIEIMAIQSEIAEAILASVLTPPCSQDSANAVQSS